MQSLNRSDLLPGELAPMTLRQLPEADRAIGHTMQPFDLEPQRFRDAAHNPLPALGECQLDLD